MLPETTRRPTPPQAESAPAPPGAPAGAAARAWPTVPGHWLWGCMGQVQREPLALYHGAWRRHGDYVRLRALPGIYFFLLTHPDAVEHVLVSNHRNYRKPDTFNRSIDVLTGNGVLNTEGETWRRQRRLMQPAFLKQSVARLGGAMGESIGRFVDEWRAAGDGRTVDVLGEMMRLGLRIASTTLLGTDISGEADSIGRAYRTGFEYVSLKMNSRLLFQPLWLPTRRNRQFRQAKALLDRIVLQLIERRRGEAPRDDVLGRLLAAQDEDSGQGMTDQELKDQTITLLTAGHETAGAALSWAWLLLAQHPQHQQALAEQARGHLQGRLPGPDDLASIPLATAIFEETMRLYPPAWGMPRESIGPDTVQGYPMPPKATIILMQHIVHRHPDFWSDPERFDPGRFLPGQEAGRHRFAYFPFGGGPRICIGNHMAMLEGPLVLAALAQHFELALVDGQSIEPDPTFTLRPKPAVMMTIRRRD